MNRRKLAQDLTLMLLYLNSWEEQSGRNSYRRAWKGYEFDDLNLLENQGYISGSHASKSVYLHPKGMAAAEKLFENYGLKLDPIPQSQAFYQLVLSFKFYELKCSRTLLVPERTTFEDLHVMIQACFNWLNYHLFNFTLKSNGKEFYISLPDEETGDDPRLEYAFRGEKLSEWCNAEVCYLDDFLPETKKMLYSYDYGDGWEIEIKLQNKGEKIASDVPICLKGVGDAPPEDVGGEGGFIDFLNTISDPNSEDYEEWCEWGESQGFEHFSLPLTNRRLTHWFDWKAANDEEALGFLGDASQDDESTRIAMMLLLHFEATLRDSGLSEKTVQQHMDNTAFFVFAYLRDAKYIPIEESPYYLDDFFGSFFITKCEWSSPTSLKGMATSLKKFYKYLYDMGVIDKALYQEAQNVIKAGLPAWLKAFNAKGSSYSLPHSGFKLV